MAGSLKKVMSIITCIAIMITMLPTFGLVSKAHAYAGPNIEFHHDGEYEIDLDDRLRPPVAQAGDYLHIDNTIYLYSSQSPMSMFLNGNTPDPYEFFEAQWIDDPNTFEPGGTYYFHYYLEDYNGDSFYSKPIPVKIKGQEPPQETVELELTLSSERTVDRAYIGILGNNAIPAERANDTLNVRINESDNLYTHDGMEFVKGGYTLYDLVGENEGHEWADDEDFTGTTARYHYYIVKDGQKYVSNDVEVTLTGEMPEETKDIAHFAFVHDGDYELPLSQSANPPAPVDGDTLMVVYGDNSTEQFVFDEDGTQGADFYNTKGQSISQIATDDWEYSWTMGQQFVEGATVFFSYRIGNLVSNSVPVLLTEDPIEPVPVSISFSHSGNYTMIENTGNVLPAPVDGDSITVMFNNESEEEFVYSSENGVFVSTTKQRDIESLGLELGQEWKGDQEFVKGNTVYFRWNLGELETADIPVLVTENLENAARKAIGKAEESKERAESEMDKAENAIEAAEELKNKADRAAKNDTLDKTKKAADKAIEAAENAVGQAQKALDAAQQAKKDAEDALEKAKASGNGELIEKAKKLLEDADKNLKDALEDLEDAKEDYRKAIELKKKLSGKNNLLSLKMKKSGNRKIVLKWNRINGAKKYVVYGAKCKGKNKVRKLKTVKKNTFTVKGLKRAKYYKFRVVAKDENGKTITKSIIVHVKTKGGKLGNYKAVIVKKGRKTVSSITLKAGKTVKLTGKQIKGRKPVSKHQSVIFKTSNKKIATVTAKGLVKGLKKGTCIVRAYAQNGLYKTVKVTIK